MKRNSGMRGVDGLPALVPGFNMLVDGCRAKTSESSAGSNETAAKEETIAVTVEGQVVATVALLDGVYATHFETGSPTFYVSKAMHDRGTLTVKDGKMILHVSLQLKRIPNLFPRRTEDAKKDGAVLLQLTADMVKFEDGNIQEACGFDIPVPALGTKLPSTLAGAKDV